MPTISPQVLPPAIKAHLERFDLSRCFSCGTCSSGCPITGMAGMEGWDARKVLRMLALGQVDQVVESKWPWLCTGCGRCSLACPMGIDIVPIFGHMKSLRPRDQVPTILQKGVERVLASGNNMGIPQEDYLLGMAELGNELAEECPGFYVPVDKQDADILFFPNSKEVYGDFEDQFWWWKIFYAARENWTVPSENWEAVDWGLFSGNAEATKTLARRKVEMMREFNIKRMIMPDCGGGSYGCRTGLKLCSLEDPSNQASFLYLYDYLTELFKSGRITVDKSVHAGKRFTWHDSCKHGRELERHFGKGYYDEPRWLLEQCVDDFVDMTPSRANNYCCGAGGGNWPMPYEKESASHARFKIEQITRTGADVVVVGCSNCRDQIMKRIPRFYPDAPKYEVKYLWEVIADALVIEPLAGAELARAQAEADSQWRRYGIELE